MSNRVNYTPEQLDLLEDYFSENQNPSPKDFKRLQTLIDIDVRKIQIWFQNRRAKNRKIVKRNLGIPQDPLHQMRKALSRNQVKLPFKPNTNWTPLTQDIIYRALQASSIPIETPAITKPDQTVDIYSPAGQGNQFLITMEYQETSSQLEPNAPDTTVQDEENLESRTNTQAEESPVLVTTRKSSSGIFPEEDAIRFAKMFGIEMPESGRERTLSSLSYQRVASNGRNSFTLCELRLSVSSMEGNCPKYQVSVGSLSSISSQDFKEMAKLHESVQVEKLEDDVFSPISKTRNFELPSFVNFPYF